jgi:hypothetical protein
MNESLDNMNVELKRLLRTVMEAQTPSADLIEDLKAELIRRHAALSDPERKQELVRNSEGPCVFCGTLSPEEHKPYCNDICEQRLSEVGLSERQLKRGDSRQFSSPKSEEGEAIETPLTTDGLSSFYRFRSWRERNWHKKKGPGWFKWHDKTSEIVQLIVLTLRYGDLLAASPKTARHAMRSLLRMRLKWGTNRAMNGKRAAGLAAIRMDLDRLRKQGKWLQAQIRLFARFLSRQRPEKLWKMLIRYTISVMREMSLSAENPDSEAYKAAAAWAQRCLSIKLDPNQPMPEMQKAFQEWEARLGYTPVVVADPSHLSPQEVKAYFEREIHYAEWQLELAANPNPEPATPAQIQALDEGLDKLGTPPDLDLPALLKYLTRSKSATSSVQSTDPKETE